jgi:transposase
MSPAATEHYRRRVRNMLAKGLSQREIAEALGIHRRSVERIATVAKKTKAQSIVQYHRGGKSRAEISRLVGCSLGVVDRAIEDYASNASRTVKPYRCKGCDEAGVYWVTNLKPCVRCRARAGR